MACGGRAQAVAMNRASSGGRRTNPPRPEGGLARNRRAPLMASPPRQCTVIVACPVLPWLVANTVAVPGARPSARSPLHDPHGYTKTTVVSELNQDAPPPSSRPVESRSTAWRYTPLSPAVSVAVSGTMVTDATDANCTTWTVSESVKPPLVARMVAVPACWPVTWADTVSPGAVTVATLGSLLVHVTGWVYTGFPLASPTDAQRKIVPPTPTCVGPLMWM